MSELSVSAYTMETFLPGGETVLFNALSQSICILDPGVWEKTRNSNNYPTRQAYELMRRGFLVENWLDEVSALSHWRLTMVHDLSHLTYYIHTGSRGPGHLQNSAAQTNFSGGMAMPTARQVLEFMIEDIETKRPLTVEAAFGGPDCLSRAKPLNYLAESLCLFCRGKNIEFKIHLLAHGPELKSDRILYLKRFGLEGVRIVLTDADMSDDALITRRLISPITALDGMIGLYLEISYNPESAWKPKISHFLDRLSDRGVQSALNGIRLHPAHPDHLPSLPPFHPFPDCACQGHAGNELFLERELTRRGFSYPQDPPRRRCPARYRSTIMIEPDGRISCCPCLSHRPELDQGHVLQGIDFRKESLIKFQSIPARCRPCPVQPLCDGGCLGFILGSSPSTASDGCPNRDLASALMAYVMNQSTRGPAPFPPG